MVGAVSDIRTVLLAAIGVATAAAVGCSLVNQYEEVPALGRGGAGGGGSCQDAAGCDDGDDCTDDVCLGGACQHDLVASGTPCISGSASGLCNVNGQCDVECTADDPGVCDDGKGCTADGCDQGSGKCFHEPLYNVPGQVQTPGDCQLVMCQAGGEQPTNDDSDVPDDGNPCTVGQCASGNATHVPVPNGTACDDGLYCSGMVGSCQQGVCVGIGDPCPGPDGDADCSESCDEASDSCNGNDPPGSACTGGLCDNGGQCTCGFVPTPPGGSCPGVCDSCSNGTCKIDCIGDSACKGQSVACPQGWACQVTCDSGGGGNKDACRDLKVYCPDLYACTVDCSNGYNGCKYADVYCSTGTCAMSCDSSNSVCDAANLYCGSNSCTATCTGISVPYVECDAACSCTIC